MSLPDEELNLLSSGRRQAGEEPLPGYRLLEPLGAGGFGEVWKCVVSGGLFKAIKFVDGALPNATEAISPAAQELASLERVKAIRHPFILSIERIEVIGNTLMIVMELADKNLQTVLLECQMQGQPGIPRDALLSFLYEAAEALDEMNFKYGLQHLDIKPHNLFVTGNHVKVADFGLVHSLGGPSRYRRGGLTPLYAAPELYRNSLSQHSDQYSLGIVYQQLLTGTVPFSSPNPYLLSLQHQTATPDLSPLPVRDQTIVARALAKDPEQRFPSCQDFIRALLQESSEGSSLTRTRLLQRLRQPAPAPESHRRTSVRPPDPPVTVPQLPAGGQPVPSPTRVTAPKAPSRTAGGGLLASTPQVFQPTCVQVPGYRFLECQSQTLLGEIWTVADSSGKQRRGFSLISMSAGSAQALTNLVLERQPALPAAEVFWSPAGRLVLVTDLDCQSLRQHFNQCQKEGQPGIPRARLLDWLRTAAEALDQLASRRGLQHLGLNPGNLLINGDRLLLGDFGLVQLVWMPMGQPPGQLNQRYAARELFGGTRSASSDQYSLALIYAEMLTGIYPRLNQPNSRSGSHRRPLPNSTRARALDLDLLPAGDRQVISRALHEDPAQRFPSCTALFEALAKVSQAQPTPEGDLFATLPLVIPFSCLMGRPIPPAMVMPVPGKLVAEWIQTATGPVTVAVFENLRYVEAPGGHWTFRCPVQLFAGLVRLKLEGFRQHWNAELISEDNGCHVFQVKLQNNPRRLWSFRRNQPTGLEIRVQVDPSLGSATQVSEAVIEVIPFGGDSAELRQASKEMAPRLFQSLRVFLQANPEQRSQQRWPFSASLRVYPIRPDLEVAGVLEARARNISEGGLSFVVSRELPTEFVYLHLHESPQLASLALFARVLRIQATEDGQFEVGVTFQVDGPPAQEDDSAPPVW